MTVGGQPVCPICKLPADASYRPFCSKRCADVDLGRWLTGGYVVAAENEGDSLSDDALDAAKSESADVSPDRS